jgi:hypothetical protein
MIRRAEIVGILLILVFFHVLISNNINNNCPMYDQRTSEMLIPGDLWAHRLQEFIVARA